MLWLWLSVEPGMQLHFFPDFRAAAKTDTASVRFYIVNLMANKFCVLEMLSVALTYLPYSHLSESFSTSLGPIVAHLALLLPQKQGILLPWAVVTFPEAHAERC
jgi:hypothetical protein